MRCDEECCLTLDVYLDPPAHSGRVTVAGDTEIAPGLCLPDPLQLQDWTLHTELWDRQCNFL